MGVVLINAADPCGCEQHRVRPMLVEPVIDRRLVAQINFIATDCQNLAFFPHQPAD